MQLDTQLGEKPAAASRGFDGVQREAAPSVVSIKSQDRPASTMPIADTLVAASLVAAIHTGGHIERVEPTVFASQDPAPAPLASAPASTPDNGPSIVQIQSSGETGADEAAPEHSLSHTGDDMAPEPADISDKADVDTGSNADDQGSGSSSDALFDLVAVHPTSQPDLMGGLLSLAAQPTPQPDVAQVAANDPAAQQVLAEVVEQGGVDKLIDAVVGANVTTHAAANDHGPAADLAHLLSQDVAGGIGIPTSQPVEIDLHQIVNA